MTNELYSCNNDSVYSPPTINVKGYVLVNGSFEPSNTTVKIERDEDNRAITKIVECNRGYKGFYALYTNSLSPTDKEFYLISPEDYPNPEKGKWVRFDNLNIIK